MRALATGLFWLLPRQLVMCMASPLLPAGWQLKSNSSSSSPCPLPPCPLPPGPCPLPLLPPCPLTPCPLRPCPPQLMVGLVNLTLASEPFQAELSKRVDEVGDGSSSSGGSSSSSTLCALRVLGASLWAVGGGRFNVRCGCWVLQCALRAPTSRRGGY